MQTNREIFQISRMHLHPTQEDLENAVNRGDLAAVRFMLNHPEIDPSSDNNIVIKCASSAGHEDVVRLLLQDPRVDPTAAIWHATSCKNANVLRLLLQDSRVDSIEDINSVLATVCREGDIDMVRVLLEDPRVDPTADNGYAIKIALAYKNRNIVDLLVKDRKIRIA